LSVVAGSPFFSCLRELPEFWHFASTGDLEKITKLTLQLWISALRQQELHNLDMALSGGLVQSGAAMLTGNINGRPFFNQDSRCINVAPNRNDMKRTLSEAVVTNIRARKLDASERRKIGRPNLIENDGQSGTHIFRRSVYSNQLG